MSSVGQATNTVADTGFALSAVLVVAGMAGGFLSAELAREVYDIPIAGGDLAYTALAAVALLTISYQLGFAQRPARVFALGMVGGGVASVAEDFGLLEEASI